MYKCIQVILILLGLTLSLNSYGNVDVQELKEELKNASNSEDKYLIYHKLIQKYKTFDLDSALIFADEAIEIYESNNDRDKVLRFIGWKSACLRLKGNCREAIDLCLRDIEEAKRKVPLFAPVYFFELGDSYDCLGKIDSAFYYFIKSDEFCRKTEDAKCSDCLTPIADLYIKIGNYDRAYELCQQSLAENQFEKPVQKYIAAYMSVVSTEGMNDPEKWIDANNILDGLKIEMGFDSLSVFHYNHIEISNLPEEEKETFLKKALNYAIMQGHDISQARIISSLAHEYYDQNDLNKFEEHFNQYFNKFQSLPSLKAKMAQYYSVLLKNDGQYKKALRWSENYISLKDSLDKSQNEKLVFELQEKYKSVEKEKELADKQVLLQSRTNQRNLFLSLGSILALLSLLGFSRFRSKQKLDTSKILHLEKERKILSMNAMLEGQEAERIRIAKDLHDGLGGMLSSVKARLSNIMGEVRKIESFNIYEKTTEMVDEACDEVRRISHNLLPGSLRLSGLKTAIEQLGEELNESHSFNVNTEVIGYEEEIDETTEVFIFRIIQEAINNIVKHAKAENVLIQLTETDDEYHITVEDDGEGFDTESEYAGIGLKSIQSRAEFLNGEMDLVSNLGVGSTLTVHIPRNSNEKRTENIDR